MWRLAGLGLLGLLFLTAVVKTPAEDNDEMKQAIERGVAALQRMQSPDGTWPFKEIGMTALAGMTLLECGIPANDPGLRNATAAVRNQCVSTNKTYSIALSLMFLDRLGDPEDIPLIESLAVRLLAGQAHSGGFSYTCPTIPVEEMRRLSTRVRPDKEPDRRTKTKESAAPARRTVKDLPREIQQQLLLLNRQGKQGPGFANMPDNSNTQFATLGLWVARKHGLPVDAALNRVHHRFRNSQNPDGGWGYTSGEVAPGMSSTTMTCAGMLGLTVAHGVAAAQVLEKNPKAKVGREAIKDPVLVRGVNALATAIDHPLAKKFKDRDPRPRHPIVDGKAFYFLWSLERLAVALDLNTIGGKDWHAWGTEILIDNQRPDGSWQGGYAEGGADTCFALLFLRRANFAKDLTTNLRGQLADMVVLRGDASRVPEANLKPAMDPRETKVAKDAPGGKEQPRETPKEKGETPKDPVVTPKAPQGAQSARLARDFIQKPATEQARALESLREGKGTVYTEALAAAIPQLKGETRRKARLALAERLTRMKDETLGFYLKDEDGEIRRAAALACAMKEARTQIPNLLLLLDDPDMDVVRAAHLALKELSGETIGPAKEEWQAWWNKQPKS